MTTANPQDTKQIFARILSYSKPYRAGLMLAFLGMLGYAGVDSYFISKLQPLIDEGLSGKNPTFMYYAPYFVVGAFILRGTGHFIGNYCLAWVGNNVIADLRQQLFEHYLSLPVVYHDKVSTGSMISKLTFDIEQIFDAITRALLTLVQQGAFVIGLLAVMFYNSWQLTLIFLLIVPVVTVIVSYVSKRFRKVSKNIQNAMGEVTSSAEQTLNGHKVVITFDGKQREYQRFAQINKHNRQQRMKMVATKAASVPIIQILASTALAAVLYLATLDSLKESLSAGVFTTVLTAMAMLLRPLKQLTTVNSDFQRGMAACASVFAVLDEQQEQDTGKQSLSAVTGKVQFDHVSFCYPGDEQNTLSDINFELTAGKTLALVGRSGSGKTTLTSLLLRFYQANQGKILIDGHDISQCKLSDVRKQFAYVSQQVVLFNDTISNNIAYGKPDATREQIELAAKHAHVLEFAEQLPQGLDTNIGENGGALSGGQRQRIAIARALLCDAPILILDEATSALDTESERHIQAALEQLQKNRTCIVIAHRLSTIENADQIMVLDKGVIVEQGKHQQLLEQQGMYAQLHHFQFGDS